VHHHHGKLASAHAEVRVKDARARSHARNSCVLVGPDVDGNVAVEDVLTRHRRAVNDRQRRQARMKCEEPELRVDRVERHEPLEGRRRWREGIDVAKDVRPARVAIRLEGVADLGARLCVLRRLKLRGRGNAIRIGRREDAALRLDRRGDVALEHDAHRDVVARVDDDRLVQRRTARARCALSDADCDECDENVASLHLR